MTEVEDIELPGLAASLHACVTERTCDMFTYSGRIRSDEVSRFITFILQRKKNPDISLVLTTFGGDAHAAYRLARTLQTFYENIRVLIVGPCKSAGTLVTICAQELVFGPFGELGPLDIQVNKKDDLMSVGSGLDTFQAFSILQHQAYAAFEDYLIKLLEGSEGAISTVTACEISCKLVTGLLAPIAAQIDPQKMGEMQRMISIAKAYGQRLGLGNLKAGALNRLVEEYPSHGFIIDYREAEKLFKNVTEMTSEEVVVVMEMDKKGYCTVNPGRATLFGDVSSLLPGADGENLDHENATRDTQDTGPHESGERGESREASSKRAHGSPRTRRRGKAAPPQGA